MPPLPAIVRTPTTKRENILTTTREGSSDDSRWLVQFAIIAVVTGVIAILFIAIFNHL